MARRSYFRKVTRRKKGLTIPIAIVAGVAPGAVLTYNAFKNWGAQGGVTTMGRIYTGYDNELGKFNFMSMRNGTFPILAGFAIHKIASALGVNAAIARAGIPIVRI